MSNIAQSHTTYAEKLNAFVDAVSLSPKSKNTKAVAAYVKSVSPKTQCDFLNEVRIIAGEPEWKEFAEALDIKPRALVNYRLPEHSGNYRTMNNATLRNTFAYLDSVISKQKGNEAEAEEIEEISQRDLFDIIKSVTGDPIWKDLGKALDIKYVTLLNYILPEDSNNYRKLSPAAYKELVALKDKLLRLTEEGKEEHELWNMIKDGAFETPDINIDLSEYILEFAKKKKALLEDKAAKKMKAAS